MKIKIHLLNVCVILALLSGRALASGEAAKKIENEEAASVNTEDPIETSPSVTSVHHQVWTSSSSGSLDELSPEIISKLRQDVPFLAAYALRPRLVGVSPPTTPTASNPTAQIMSDLIEHSEPIESKRISSTLESPLANQVAPTSGSLVPPKSLDSGSSSNTQLRTATSSGKAARQTSLIPKLGDFSELNVETSSTSKSEHHHKRKTSLKRPQKDADDGQHSYAAGLQTDRGELRRKMIAEASRLIKNKRQRRQNKSGRRSRSSKRKNSDRLRSSGRSGRLKKKNSQKLHQTRMSRLRSKMNRRNLQHHMSMIKHGRLLQDSENNEIGGNTKDSGVKGGSGRTNKRPFYASGRSPAAASESAMDLDDDDDDERSRLSPDSRARPADGQQETPTSTRSDDVPKREVDDDDDGTIAINDEPSEPRRVGDDDVEEDGDTVMIKPKFDGVDDDPPLPEDSGAGSAGGSSTNGDTDERETSSNPPAPAEGDERGNRVDRERPLDSDGPGQPSQGDGSNQDQPSLVGGGGIGATIGGGGGSQSGGDDGKSSMSPGVELADDNDDDDDDDDDDDNDDDDRDERRTSGVGASSGHEVGNGERASTDAHRGDGSTMSSGDEGNFGSRMSGSGSSSSDKKDTDKDDERAGGAATGDDVDVDYRDDELPARGVHEGRTKDGGRGEHDSVDDKMKPSRKHHAPDCVEDGSYKEHDEKYHDQHHQTIDWLRGSIPGEPGEDYPILSRANGTNFNCANQKYPGYYADVESRCQEFHICQADGRQDSFLCPNGTVFSQKTLVCVWWNGFDCEDAPKYYHLNALLFKSRDGNESPQSAALPSLGQSPAPSRGDLRPLDMGAQMKPRRTDMSSLDNDDDEAGSSIDDLIRAMRRERPQASGSSSDDEATVQRKSTDIGDDQAVESARLRKGAVQRRKRRANARQAPPKLKSRRISRNSRRRKLRHGIKPRRRA